MISLRHILPLLWHSRFEGVCLLGSGASEEGPASPRYGREGGDGWNIPTKYLPVYSTMLIVLNRRALPDEIRLKGWRLPIIIITAVFLIALSLFLLYQIITAPWSRA